MRTSILLLIILLLSPVQTLAEEEYFVYQDGGRRNPFLPLVDSNGRYLLDAELSYSSSELALTGILWDAQGDSSALISNQIVKVGESIGAFVVKEITKDSVKMIKGGKEYIMKLSITGKGE